MRGLGFQAEEAWQQLEEFEAIVDVTDNNTSFVAGYAVVAALFEVSGTKPFGCLKRLLGPEDRDVVLGSACADAALWAAIAHGGGVWYKEYDPSARLQFWTWWIREAIPALWNSEFINGVRSNCSSALSDLNVIPSHELDAAAQQVIDIAHELELELPQSLIDETDTPRYYASRPELQQAILGLNEAISIPDIMGSVSHRVLFRLAALRGRALFVADAIGLHVFYPDGASTTFPAELLLSAIRKKCDLTQVSSTGWEEWSSQQFISAMSDNAPPAIRQLAFEALIAASYQEPPSFISEQLSKLSSGQLTPSWEEAARLMSPILVLGMHSGHHDSSDEKKDEDIPF